MITHTTANISILALWILKLQIRVVFMRARQILIAFILLVTAQAFTFLKTEPRLTPYDVKKSQ